MTKLPLLRQRVNVNKSFKFLLTYIRGSVSLFELENFGVCSFLSHLISNYVLMLESSNEPSVSIKCEEFLS